MSLCYEEILSPYDFELDVSCTHLLVAGFPLGPFYMGGQFFFDEGGLHGGGFQLMGGGHFH